MIRRSAFFSSFILLQIVPFQLVFASDRYSKAPESYGVGERDDEVDWSMHPCKRQCEDGSEPLTCRYGLTVESYSSMSRACYNCPHVLSDCFRPHCIPADGQSKLVIVANRRLPGNLIEVCKGDRLIVDVTNGLTTDTTTIHWHGLEQRGSPFMDGVPYLTQCPIMPGETFRYDFLADQAGSYMWHSHSGEQRADGLFGGLIVRESPTQNVHGHLYDYDEHQIILNDWTAETGLAAYVLQFQNSETHVPHTILVNGLGPYKSWKEINPNISVPADVFKVEKGKRYRFRLINIGALNCPLYITIEKHTMLVINTDGVDIEPVEVDSIRLLTGERYDFILEANQESGEYKILYKGDTYCAEYNCHQESILRYENHSRKVPVFKKSLKTTDNHVDESLFAEKSRELNPFNKGTETPDAISIPTLNSLDNNDDEYSGTPDHTFYISYDLFGKDNTDYHRKNLYGYHQVSEDKRQTSLQLNHITFKPPNFPVLTEPDLIEPGMICNETTVTNCAKEFCACTYVLGAKLNSLVELIIIDEGSVPVNHPMHLHGYHFRVVAMEKVNETLNAEQVRAMDRDQRIHRKLKAAPLKDTVIVPSGGYTIVRFRANNPGYWLFHCHFDQHANNGQALVIQVGEHKDFPKIPKDFPKCGKRKT